MIWCPTVMSVRVALAKKQIYGKIRLDKGRTDLAKKKKKDFARLKGTFFVPVP